MDIASPSTTARPAVSFLTWFRTCAGYLIPQQPLAFFFESASVLLGAGYGLPDALLKASAHSDPELQAICRVIAPELSRGASLTAALRPYSHRLPDLVLPILEVGEAAGTMEGSTKRLADAFNQSLGVKRRIKYGAFDPWLVIAIMTLLSAVTMTIIAISNSTPVPLTLEVIGILLGTILSFVGFSISYLAGRIITRQLMRLERLRLWVDTIKLALPRLGLVFRNLAAARWARSYATLWSAGVMVSYALEISSRSALNAHYEKAICEAAASTRQGRSLHDSLKATQLLPANLLSVIAIGETSSHVAEALARMATAMEEEAYHRSIQEMNGIVIACQVTLMFLAVALAMH